MGWDTDTETYVPCLAESVELSDDGLVYTVKLREGVTFHDGEAVTADDVVFTFTNTIVGRGIRSNKLTVVAGYDTAPDTGKVEGIQKVDDLTVTFTLTQPDGQFVSALANSSFGILPSHR